MENVSEVKKVALELSVDEKQLEKGWNQVRDGISCLYPDCFKKSYSAAFRGIPLCKGHFDLAQFIFYVVFKSHEEITHP